MTSIRAAAFLLLLAMPAQAATCDFADYRANVFLDGPCTQAGDAAPVFTLKGRSIRVEYGDHQGRFHRWRLNGKAASAYEFNREAYCAWTDDLSQSFCYALRGPLPQ
jgi:hypothetical protein